MLRSVLTAFFLTLAICAAMPAPAQASVALTPTLLVIEGRTRYTDLTIINTSTISNTYEMGWKFFKMEQDSGDYIEADKATTDFDLSQHLVFTPRRITLGPNSAQKVRFALRLNGEPPAPGDYRTHFLLKEIPQRLPELSDTTDEGQASVNVNINIGFTIPIIYRVGISDATATIGKIHVGRNAKNGKIEVVVPVTKSQSPYGILGNLAVFHKTAKGEKLVGQISNANIFPEVTKRVFTVTLNTDALEGGSLHVVYSDVTSQQKKVFSDTTIPIGKQ